MGSSEKFYKVIKVFSLLLFFAFLFPPTVFVQENKGVEQLIKDLQADTPLVRKTAAEQLGKAKDAKAVGPLLDTLGDKDGGVRRAVTTALGDIGNAEAVNPIGKMLDDTDEQVRMNAIGALKKIGGDEATGLIIAALTNDKLAVRTNAAATLGSMKSSKAIEPLEQVIQNDAVPSVRFAAEQALIQIRGTGTGQTPGKEPSEMVAPNVTAASVLADLEPVAARIQQRYGLLLDYKKYDIMDLLDIEARMHMRHPKDTIESLLGTLLTKEDMERNRTLFPPKQ
jgi:hypothetical protein